MRARNSSTGFFGVRECRGSFRAFYEHRFERKLVAECSTAAEAAEAFDKFLVKKWGIRRAFAKLNFPEKYQEQYDLALSQRQRALEVKEQL